MESFSFTSLNPALLPAGTQVGPWRVVEWVGRGVHGAVYRAVRVGQEHSLPVALKLALHPRDPRFAREVEVLSRSHHPHIPRLLDHGEWQHPDGTVHPYLAMQWVDGVPLYEWARLYHPTPQQMLRLLAQLALALQYLHAQGAVHRDVKGDNTLVCRSDSRLFLTDFGSSIYPGADTFTPPPLPPGTPAYRSPEAWLFSVQHSRAFTAPYSAGPADDLFALGVTACRLATGAYPAMGEAQKDEHGTWRMESLVIPRALHSARVAPPLRSLILRMFSLQPEERGTAALLARDMEHAASSLTGSHSAPSGPRARMRIWLAAAAAAGALATCAGWLALGALDDSDRIARTATAAAEEKDSSRPVGIGKSAASTSTERNPAPSAPRAMAEDTPPEPLPGQATPDAKGRCPHKRQVALNGGCWGHMEISREECEALGGSFFKKTCYVPIIAPRRSPPTSSPADQP